MRHMSFIPEKEWIPAGLIGISFRKIKGGVTEFRQQIVRSCAGMSSTRSYDSRLHQPQVQLRQRWLYIQYIKLTDNFIRRYGWKVT